MKICFIGPANSAHMVKWCNWFTQKGHEVHIISFTDNEIKNTNVHFIDVGVNAQGCDLGKIKYLFAGRKIKQLVDDICPDIINVHYATSYGAAVALSGLNNYVLSVWGADIYDFPRKSFFHKVLLKYSLKKANGLFSTSKAMAVEAMKYTDKQFEITPFGVDTELFNPKKRTRDSDDGDFVVGTVKALTDKYGIKYILEAVAKVKQETEIPIKLRIAGKGPQEDEYKQLAIDLKIDNITTWLGFISQENAAKEWANMDVAIVPSTLESESFGVSAVEAEASGTALIISDIPGLMEATKPGYSSIVVKRNNSDEIKEALIDLYRNNEKKEAMVSYGLKYVAENYSMGICFNKIESLFLSYIKNAN